MKFNELTIDEQLRYIEGCMSLAVRVAKTLPKGNPKMSQGVFASISDRSIWDNGDEPVRLNYTTEQYTICENVICEWWRAFEKDGIVSELWKKMWIICDEELSVERKCRKIGCRRSYMYQQKKEGLEIIRKWLLKVY